jgi:SHS2 domain-containing protein
MSGNLCYANALSYTIIDHTADLGITVHAPDILSLFTEAAQALVEILGAKAGHPEHEIMLTVEGYDHEDLLIRWLEELRYSIESLDLSIAGLTIDTLTTQRLQARIKASRRTAPLKTCIKAVTYHALAIKTLDKGLATTIIFDT